MSSDYRNKLWFVESATRTTAQTMLRNDAYGAFLVRPSSQPNCLALSHVQADKAIGHVLIKCVANGYQVETSSTVFKTIPNVVLSLQMSRAPGSSRSRKNKPLDPKQNPVAIRQGVRRLVRLYPDVKPAKLESTLRQCKLDMRAAMHHLGQPTNKSGASNAPQPLDGGTTSYTGMPTRQAQASALHTRSGSPTRGTQQRGGGATATGQRQARAHALQTRSGSPAPHVVDKCILSIFYGAQNKKKLVRVDAQMTARDLLVSIAQRLNTPHTGCYLIEVQLGQERVLRLDEKPIEIFNAWLSRGLMGNDEKTHIAVRRSKGATASQRQSTLQSPRFEPEKFEPVAAPPAKQTLSPAQAEKAQPQAANQNNQQLQYQHQHYQPNQQQQPTSEARKTYQYRPEPRAASPPPPLVRSKRLETPVSCETSAVLQIYCDDGRKKLIKVDQQKCARQVIEYLSNWYKCDASCGYLVQLFAGQETRLQDNDVLLVIFNQWLSHGFPGNDDETHIKFRVDFDKQNQIEQKKQMEKKKQQQQQQQQQQQRIDQQFEQQITEEELQRLPPPPPAAVAANTSTAKKNSKEDIYQEYDDVFNRADDKRIARLTMEPSVEDLDQEFGNILDGLTTDF